MLLVDKHCQVERVVGLFFGSNNQRLAVVESHTDVLKGSVEGDGGDAKHALGIRQHTVGKHIGRMTIEVVADAFVAEHHTLGTACRAAGVDEVGQIVAGDIRHNGIGGCL